ncbi:recombinase family protein [Streptomyces sp. H27-C3]|uniref:recombinase family protein n=1 Tax=Streptomyces sp. H27-C3 TaxID=3046305 RepID=UPI0024B89FF9|nr:recombinase family protein [Streptomyces sp. H27-C3]MDJ0463200.1 recombinase family protein [Streptomyces sp. H27-C3]
MHPEVVRVGLYLRVSTQDQLLGYGLQVQDEENHAYVGNKSGLNWVVVDIYRDEGESGASETRGEMLRLEADVKAGKLDVVVVHRFDRIGRTGKAFWRWVWAIQDAGAALVSVTQEIDTTTTMGTMALQQYASFSEMEWRTIKERTVRGINYKASRGGWPSGQPPYGYRLEGKGQRGSYVMADPGESRVLKLAGVFIVDLGMSCPKAATVLNALGYRTRNGKRWTGDNLRSILQGNSLLGRVIFRNPDRKGQTKNSLVVDRNGNPTLGPTYEIPLPPIGIPAERRMAIRATLSTTAKKKTLSGHTYFLSGRVFGKCSKHYTGGFVSATQTSSYRCSGRRSKGGCSDGYYPATDIEHLVWAEIVGVLGDRNMLTRLAEEWAGATIDDTEDYETRVRDLTKQIDEKVNLVTVKLVEYAEAGVDAVVVAAAQKKMKEDIEELTKQRNIAADRLEEISEVAERKQNVLALADMAADRLMDLSPARKAEVADLLDIRVEITEEATRMRTSYVCPGEEYFKASGRMVPDALSDRQWDRLVEAFPKLSGDRRVDSRRVIDAMFTKIRAGVSWAELDASPGTPYWRTVSNTLKRWVESGFLEALLDALGPYSGTQAPAAPHLPSMRLTGVLDPRVGAVTVGGEGNPHAATGFATVLAPTGTDSQEYAVCSSRGDPR